MSAGGSTKVIFFALAANLGIAIAKGVAAVISGSAAMMAEGIHSLVDCANQVLLLIGAKAAAKAPDERHPLGYGREVFFWSFIVAILLFSMGGVFAIREGIHRLHEDTPPSSPLVGFVVLGVSIVLEAISFHACLKEVRATAGIRREDGFGGWARWFHRTTKAELLVVMTEDTAALLGLVIALLSLILTVATGAPIWDAVGSIAVGSLLVVVALLLAVEIKSLIIGEAPAENLRPSVERLVAAAIPGGRVLSFIALQSGPNEILLAYKVHPGEEKDVLKLVDAINRVEREVKARHPEVAWQFVEPDTIA